MVESGGGRASNHENSSHRAEKNCMRQKIHCQGTTINCILQFFFCLVIHLLTYMVCLWMIVRMQDTVEERMQQVQARKQRMIAGALTDEEVRSARLEELKMLFR